MELHLLSHPLLMTLHERVCVEFACFWAYNRSSCFLSSRESHLPLVQVEATSAYRGVGIVKLMGKHSGFIAVKAGQGRAGQAEWCRAVHTSARRVQTSGLCSSCLSLAWVWQGSVLLMPSLHLPPTVQAALSSGLVDIVLVPEVSPDRGEDNC